MRSICDPLDYIDEIPPHYWEDDPMTGYNIPPHIKTIRNSAFYGCTKLESLYIPDGVDLIEEDAFGDCSNLKELSLPDTVRVLEPGIFSGCDNLIEISFRGTIENWKSIKKNLWDYDSYIKVIHCLDGDIPSEQSSRPVIQY